MSPQGYDIETFTQVSSCRLTRCTQFKLSSVESKLTTLVQSELMAYGAASFPPTQTRRVGS